MPLVEVRQVTKIFHSESLFGKGSSEVRAVDHVSFTIERGETLGLVGESGSGKSTLGRLVLRLIEPTSGEIYFEGKNILDANAYEMRNLRRDMQIIFQDPFGSLDPRMRVQDVLAEPFQVHDRLSPAEIRTKTAQLLRSVGLDGSRCSAIRTSSAAGNASASA